MRKCYLFFTSVLALIASVPFVGAPACAQKDTTAPTAVPAVATRISDVIYRKKGGVALTMDVFKPAKPSGIGVLWMVSGGWVSDHNGINAGLAKLFNDRGITLIFVMHGSQPKYTVAEIVDDIHRAVRFVRTNAATYGVDPNRLGISGASAGGHLSLMMATYGADGKPDARDPIDRASSRVQAAALFYPPTDMLNYGKEGVAAFTLPMLRGYQPAFGTTDATPKEEMAKISRALSPIYGISASTPPILLIHGDADTLVPLQQSERFLTKLKEKSIPCELIVKKGKGHGWEGMDQDMLSLITWYEKYLAKK
jgi:acetyl esterase/lipase